ncbi:MAG TPA: FAD-dependent oxidoreductase [Thermoanaerobaculia bacterium]|nr:FAD-dependent oxidoreductase [Thermoanaerobaculia bacterium]
MRRFDVLVIGGGQAGIPLAHALARAGKNVALAERRHLGGSCVNFGCTPTKAAIASASAAFQARRGAVFGLRIPTVEVDFPAVLDRARSIVVDFRAGLRRGFEKAENPALLRGHARILKKAEGGFAVRVGEEEVAAATLVLNTGTRALEPPIRGLRDGPLIHAGNWLDHHELPRHLLFIGGGYIALEMGQFYLRMGSRVTIIDQGTQILQREDEDVALHLQKLLESEGIEFRLGCRVEKARRSRGGTMLEIRSTAGPGLIRGSAVFLSAGRRPNTDDLGLESVGVRTTPDGFVGVDERLATNVPGIYAAGDIRGGPMFTHTSWDDYRILESQLAGDGSKTTRRIVPYAVYTDPELGRVGKTERELREAGEPYRTGRFEMRNNGKAIELSETEGMIKVLVEKKSGQILGAAVLAVDGSELIHMFVGLMNAKAPYTVLRDAVHIHPTLAEAVQSAAAAVQ